MLGPAVHVPGRVATVSSLIDALLLPDLAVSDDLEFALPGQFAADRTQRWIVQLLRLMARIVPRFEADLNALDTRGFRSGRPAPAPSGG